MNVEEEISSGYDAFLDTDSDGSPFPGHQVIEMGLVKLFRVTGNEKYLDLAKYFLDQRGHDVKLTVYPPGSRFAIYNDAEQIQAHKPIFEQAEAVGHAVRAAYMYSGMADIAALTGSEDYVRAVDRLWDNFERGPLVYCAEGVDNRGRALDLEVAGDSSFAAEFRPGLLNGVVVLKGKAVDGRAITLVPYYAWSNRGVGEMVVWIMKGNTDR